MISTNRRFLAVLSACGFAANIVAYIESFSGATIGSSLGWIIVLCVGTFVLAVPMQILEYPKSRAMTFYWKGFARGMPTWVVPCSRLLWLTAVVHFVWFAVHAGRGVPAILDGQYVLYAHGQILRVLTKAEYFALEGAELRGVVTPMISVYFLSMMYWWFPRPSANSSLSAS